MCQAETERSTFGSVHSGSRSHSEPRGVLCSLCQRLLILSLAEEAGMAFASVHATDTARCYVSNLIWGVQNQALVRLQLDASGLTWQQNTLSSTACTEGHRAGSVERPAKLKAAELAAPKAGVPPKMLGAPALAAPNAWVLAAPKAGVLAPPKPNAELLAPPSAGVEAAPPPKAGVLKPPKRDGVLAGWLCPACVRGSC